MTARRELDGSKQEPERIEEVVFTRPKPEPHWGSLKNWWQQCRADADAELDGHEE